MKQILVVVSLLGIMSCSKSGNDPGVDPNPNPDPGSGGNNVELIITTITPNSAEMVPVTINGTGFSTTASKNMVHINGLPATVTNATATSLQITLPANLVAGDHDVMVTVNGKQVTKVKGFHLVGWIVSNFAGSGDWAQVDGTGDAAAFKQPIGLAIDAAGNFYLSDLNKIRKITPQGEVSTFAGGAGSGSVDGNGTNARFSSPASIAIDNAGNLYVADQFNHQIRMITPNKEVSTLAGTGDPGWADGDGDKAKFSLPYGIAVNPSGTYLYVGDYANHVIRRIEIATRQVITLAGDKTSTRKDGKGTAAGIPSPGNLAFDADGNLLVTEKGAGMIRKIAPDGTVTTIGGFDVRQDVNIQPTHLAFDKDKNTYVTFSGGREVKKYATNGTASIFAGVWVGPDQENGPANMIQFQRPEGIVVKEDAQGNPVLYVVDSQRKKIKKIAKQ
ncbi:MAG: IPT/TIG domain-containing protein [Chitinophagaceae bacterium]|nr:IPT/TIG domain-containing protein [Chitinophagaceae bacterium]